jgi:UDP-N-acetylglucosamine 2-epimerase
MKIITLCGTRPELIRLSVCLRKFDKFFDHIFVHTGQNYDFELNEIFYSELELRKPDIYLDVVGRNLGFTMGDIITKSYELFIQEKPDAVVILGDTNSSLAAISAKRLQIPIFHLEAGNRSYSNQVPEEVNRIIIDSISDVNICYSQTARNNLLGEGHSSEDVFVAGSPIKEIFTKYKSKILNSEILPTLSLEPKKFILLSAHREENVDKVENLIKLVDAIQALQKKYDVPIIFPMHPRTAKMLDANKINLGPNIIVLKPLGYLDYCHLQLNALFVVSDSGTIVEESYVMGFKAISLRNQIERQEGIENNTVIMSGLSKENLILSSEIILQSETNNKIMDYDQTDFSEAVIKLIVSYRQYIVNRKIN